MSFRKTLALLMVLIGCAALAPVLAADSPGHNLRDARLFRFEFDNDLLIGSDDAFTAGWSFQVHSPMRDEWKPGLASWIGRLPTLGDDGAGGRIVRSATGVTQLIITPQNILISTAQPDDAPWAGTLGGYVSWTSYDNTRLAALQAYLGCLGPCSHAQEAQTFVHVDLRLGDRPMGWSNQLEDKLLANVNYEYRHKLWTAAERYETNRWGHDLSVGTQFGYGSYATYAEAWIEYRFGWELPPGFTQFADPPALGIALDPIYLDPVRPPSVLRDWRPYFNLVVRRREVEKFAVLQPRRTQNGGFYAPTISTPGEQQLIFGMHFAKLPLAFHLTYYRYFDDGGPSAIPSTLDWVNFSFEQRF